jgi:PAS domain S-box-containing protein
MVSKSDLEQLGIDVAEIFSTLADGVSIQDRSGKLLYVNDVAAKLCGFSTAASFLKTPPEKILNYFQLFNEDGTPLKLSDLPGRRVLQGEKSAEKIVCFKQTGTTKIRWSKVSARPIQNKNGEILAAINIFRDITPQKEYELELQKRAKLRATVAEFGERALKERDISVLMNEAVKQIQTLLNVDYVKILELLPDGTKFLVKAGSGWKKGYVGKTLIEANKKTQAGFTLMTQKPVIVKNIHKERRFKIHKAIFDHDVTSSVTLIINGPQRPYGIIGVHSKVYREFTQSDIYFIQLFTNILSAAIERKMLDEASKKSQEQYKLLMDQASDGILILDADTNIIEVNKKACEMFGYTKDEFIKLSAMDLIHPEEIESGSTRFNEIRKGKVVLSERRIRKKDGSFLLTELSSKLVDTNKMMSIIRDITERKQAEQQREILLGIVSHEIKNALMNITGFTYILKKHFDKTNDTKSIAYFSKLEVQLIKLSKIIIDMLDLTRIRSGRLDFREGEYRVDDLVRDVVESFQASSTHKIIVKGTSSKKLYGDKNRISQVLNNLLSNAIKYSPNAHKVVVEILEDKKFVTISVSDFGMGIPRDGLSKVFELFYRGANTQKQPNIFGIGLGLYISDIIVKHHGGKIWVESKVGKGSTFFFTLPVKRPARRSKSVQVS